MSRKLKKLLQRKKSELDPKQQEELNKSLQAYEKDHLLCPFIGINPEYMEMSESNPNSKPNPNPTLSLTPNPNP